MISINGKKKEKKEKKKKKKKQQQTTKVWSATMLAICWLLLQLGTDPVSLCSSSSFFFLRNLSSSSLVLFFFLTSPFVQDMKLSDLLPIFILLRAFSFLLDLIITSYQCIGQNSQESWNKKKSFEPQKLVTVHKIGWSDRGLCGSCFFGMEQFFSLNKP